MGKGRPSSLTVKYFQRQLGESERTILACAGNGDISLGFKVVIESFATLWQEGYRPQDDLYDFLGLDKE
jgi:hypothetical protein